MDVAWAIMLAILAGLSLLLSLLIYLIGDETHGWDWDEITFFGGSALLAICTGIALAKGSRRLVIAIGVVQFAASVVFLFPLGPSPTGIRSMISVFAVLMGLFLLARAAGIFQRWE
jgi:hypothetical protein